MAWPPAASSHKLFNIAESGAGADHFVECFQTHLPDDIDLYLLEMGVIASGSNLFRHLDEDKSEGRGHNTIPGEGLERLLRRITALPDHPAILS